jgi:hypothetical protein
VTALNRHVVIAANNDAYLRTAAYEHLSLHVFGTFVASGVHEAKGCYDVCHLVGFQRREVDEERPFCLGATLRAAYSLCLSSHHGGGGDKRDRARRLVVARDLYRRVFPNGLIGGGLQKNRHKSFSKLAAGSAGEAELVSEKADSEYFDMIARSATKFTYLVVLTTIVIVHHLGQPWWGIIGAAVTAWGASVILPMLLVARQS